MTITSVGFKGTVGQSQDAQRWGRAAVPFTVGGATDLLVAAASGDRRVQISTGLAQAGQVTASSSATEFVSLEANNGSQTRYDLIVVRFVWTDPTVTQPVLTYIKGAATGGALPLGDLLRTLGTQYDGPIAAVRIAPGQGTLTANDIFDLRIWGGQAGPPVSATIHDRLLQAIDARAVCDVAGHELRKPGTVWMDRDGVYATSAIAIQQLVGAAGTYAWTGVQNRRSPSTGAVMKAEMSFLARFLTGSQQQTLSVQVGVTGGITQEGDHDMIERLPGGTGSGEDVRPIRRTQFFICTDPAFTVGYNVVLGTGGSSVYVQNPRCFVTGPYTLI